MGRKITSPFALLAILALLVSSLGLAACGEEEDPTEVEEGEPIEIGELTYNVLFSRFLNADDIEDEAYLVGQPQAKPGELYLGVFLEIENETAEPLPSYPADQMHVTDSEGAEYEPLESRSEFALEFEEEVPAEGELPLPDSTAASGPIEGSLVLFRVDDDVTENRPLKLVIEPLDDEGEIILDI